MNHTFTFHKLAQGVDFYDSEFYSDGQIDAIQDPEGGKTRKMPTSIPSPFAAIDLMATAFAKLAETDNLDGVPIYEKIVSQCWDIGQMFFNAKGLGDKLQIIHWNRKEQLEILKNSNSQGQRILGNTLDMYLKDDAHAYNFDEFEDAYILKYNHNYFGGISPKTLFYCSLNPLEDDPQNYINLGSDDILFDKNYCPLYKRADEFQLFIYRLVKHLELKSGLDAKLAFSLRCKEFFDYLDKNKFILKRINISLFEEIELIKGEDFLKNYQPLDIKEGSHVSVLGVALRTKFPKVDGESDFKIKSTKIKEKAPMVLFRDFGGQNLYGDTMIYFDQKYTKEIDQAIPYFHENSDINARNLPGLTGVKYPYLLVDDFLEDTLFKQENEINEDEFFDCNFKAVKDKYGYLCPIKSRYFDYFSVTELMNGKTEDGKSYFELEERFGSNIVAILRIPVNKGHITLTKTYLENAKIDKFKNTGNIEKLNVDINIFPFIKYDPKLELGTDETNTCEYRTNIIINNFESFPELVFHDNDNKTIEKRESMVKGDLYLMRVDITNQYYDYINIKYKGKSAVIVPKWPIRSSPSNNFHFAIDFGTTNTHIEYIKNDQESEPFNLKENIFGRLSKNDKILNSISIKEFIPELIDIETNYRFYHRTVIAATKSIDFRKPVQSLADLRIPYDYEKDIQSNTSVYFTNLKWLNYVNSQEEEKKIKAFIEQLVIMMKTKVLVDAGKINETKFTWFYPSSMIKARVLKLEKVWIEILQKHFYIDHKNVKKLSESIAPYAYYNKKETVDSLVNPAVTIDIGGGTSDIVFFQDNSPLYLTSIRYAANSIFGDGYNSNPNQNGFVLKYFQNIRDLLDVNNFKGLVQTLDSIRTNSSRSSDIIDFFLSLENNVELKNRNISISFQEMLSNDGVMKISILLFYQSLIFHIAQFMKHSNMNIPGAIVFSGNGGKLINILDDSNDFDLLTQYTKLIFQDIFNIDSLEYNIEIKLNKNPKAITCKGGLYINKALEIDPEKITKTIVGCKIEPIKLPTYPELNDTIKQDVVASVQDSITQFFDLNNHFNYSKNFSINAGILDLSNQLLTEKVKIKESLLKGIEIKEIELNDNTNQILEEPLFFYSFVGLINKLAFHLYSK